MRWLRHRGASFDGPRMMRSTGWIFAAFVGFAAAAVAGIGLAWGAIGAGSAPATTGSGGCSPVILYFSRGSGQPPEGDERGLGTVGFALYQALRAKYGQAVGAVANGYTAISVPAALNPFSGGSYGSSVANGVQSAERNIADVSELCPRSYLIIGGFSQGAQVTRDVLAQLTGAEKQRIGRRLPVRRSGLQLSRAERRVSSGSGHLGSLQPSPTGRSPPATASESDPDRAVLRRPGLLLVSSPRRGLPGRAVPS